MKRFLISVPALLLCAIAFSQTAEEFKARYERQVKNVGNDGVGVETIIDRWEEAYPTDINMFIARFNYCYTKSQTTEMITRSSSRYLGQKPAFTLKDSAGNDVNYFEDITFDTDLFARAMTALDTAVELSPNELRYRFSRITALIAYEKESPDMAAEQISGLIDLNAKNSSNWTLDGAPLEENTFEDAIAEYLYSFFRIGSEISYDYFYQIASQMSRLYPKNTVFINDIGSYYQVVRKNNKQALKYYNKTLKIEPDNYAAKRNIKLIQSSQSQKGQSSK